MYNLELDDEPALRLQATWLHRILEWVGLLSICEAF